MSDTIALTVQCFCLDCTVYQGLSAASARNTDADGNVVALRNDDFDEAETASCALEQSALHVLLSYNPSTEESLLYDVVSELSDLENADIIRSCPLELALWSEHTVRTQTISVRYVGWFNGAVARGGVDFDG